MLAQDLLKSQGTTTVFKDYGRYYGKNVDGLVIFNMIQIVAGFSRIRKPIRRNNKTEEIWNYLKNYLWANPFKLKD